MATVFNEIDKVAGDPQRVSVEIRLVWDKSVSPVAVDADDSVMIRGPLLIQTNDEGYWETSLTPNSEITPADNAYQITETIETPSGDEVAVYYISVPDGATPMFWVGGIMIDKPDWVG